MTFKDVVGQKAAKEGLLKMWHNNVLPHALLFVGREGTGGLPLALAFAQYIFCENKQGSDSCGRCAGCSKAGRLEHADLHLSFPSITAKAGEKALSRNFIQEFREFVRQTPYGSTYDWLQHIGAENKQGNITATEAREIIEVLNLKSYEGGKKVLVMWRPEYLGREGNILLKMIEEPPPDTVLLFVSEDESAILATIRSRTQDVKLAPISAPEIAEALIERSAADPARAAQAAHIAMGSYSEALRVLLQDENDLFPEVRNLFNILFTNNGVAIAKFADDWAKAGREQQKNFLTYAVQLLEQAIRLRFRPGGDVALAPAEALFVQKLAANKIGHEALNELANCMSVASLNIERNAHGKTQLHVMAVKMHQVIRNA